ncbi:MAG: hypothetical protein HC802_12305 [Caldilineaceae bacterium]|nr:hypothetical protein [Caldilineaceae bacterium]
MRWLELPNTADGFLHYLRLVVLDFHARSGNLYPRWTPEFFRGMGYPVFNFYSPSTYYLAELLVLLGAGYGAAMVLSMVLLLLLAGFGAYLLALDFLELQDGLPNGWAALVASAAYVSAPYLLTNIYVRGAIAELGAQALLPWILWSFRRLLIADDPTPYAFVAAFSLGGLAVTHNISLLLFPPMLFIYLAVIWRQFQRSDQLRPARLCWVIGAGLAAVGVSAFFWLPLLVERLYLADNAYSLSAARISEHVWTLASFLDLHVPFEYTGDAPFQFGFVQLLVGVTGFLLLKNRTAEAWYWAAVTLILSLLIFEPLLPFWLSSNIFLIVQFPWRLLAVITLPLSLFAGGLVQRVRPGWIRAAVGLLLVGVILVAGFPQIDWLKSFYFDDDHVGLASIAQIEFDTGHAPRIQPTNSCPAGSTKSTTRGKASHRMKSTYACCAQARI